MTDLDTIKAMLKRAQIRCTVKRNAGEPGVRVLYIGDGDPARTRVYLEFVDGALTEVAIAYPDLEVPDTCTPGMAVSRVD